MPTLSFIGCGKLGRTLGHLFQRHAVFTIRQVLTRSPASAAAAVHFIGAGQPIADAAALQPADVFVLAVPDQHLAAAAQWLSDADVLDERTTVFHCSGALSSTLLTACAAQGAHMASIHPLLSFADPQRLIEAFACQCAIEGDAEAVSMLSLAFSQIGAQVIPIPTEAKLRYHSAAVMASNYLVTLAEQMLQSIESAGLTRDQGRALMLPLMHQTLDNLAVLEPKDALTGPVARGDWALVNMQQRSLAEASPALGDFYATLANATAVLAGHPPPFKAA